MSPAAVPPAEVNRGAEPGAEVSRDPRTGAATAGPPVTAPAELSALLAAAARDAHEIAATAPAVRAAWLAAVADALIEHTDELTALAEAETALGTDRLRGEVGRAAAQSRFYGSVAVEGGWLGVRIDGPATTGSVELRRINRPLGPVAVFGAGNFPFAFGVAGHDTASALAAGCPVLVKAHPAHPLLSARLGALVSAALHGAGAPAGAFALVTGFDTGLALVDAPEVAAVAFTGSQSGGTALVERAARRPVPVPVFAEMGTVNPAVLTPAAAADRAGLTAAADGFTGSFTLGQGQFCTKPGLLLAPAGSGAAEAVAAALKRVRPGWLLTEGIADAYRRGVADLVAAGAERVATVAPSEEGFAAAPTVLSAPARALRPGSRLLAECFGPVALVVEYDGTAGLREALDTLQPSLAASVLSCGPADPDLPWLVERLAGRTGRVVVDGWPTGVATSWAQQHGGPWPATSRPDATSAGAGALDRFTRPVAYQNVPRAALPEALRDGNPWHVVRRLDGVPVAAAPAGTGAGA
ncbi:aldehyde dehydrogenase family protein [Streptomyces sp. SID4919]|uniref:aldehyde dehydrogenase family protein n=1 Tax=unclassified Streptomyces TaxID=2593676 RepID=UPI000823F7F3|nr:MULTISPECIES: aldehyde dehydrogenase family protein [unclassified Streptomyces]MYY08129.1 aldehyde dehydrogenase family protein [Streptomyces sp. SID4919]SCK09220.1 NADP-dependent aldehyde dehydrogenase [Streptomyces sp. AmelKG-E11A]